MYNNVSYILVALLLCAVLTLKCVASPIENSPAKLHQKESKGYQIEPSNIKDDQEFDDLTPAETFIIGPPYQSPFFGRPLNSGRSYNYNRGRGYSFPLIRFGRYGFVG